MTDEFICPVCGGTKWKRKGVHSVCAYCGYVKTETDIAEEQLSESEALKYLREERQEERTHKTLKLLIKFMIGCFILLFVLHFFAPESAESLQVRVEAVEVVGKTAKEATRAIKKVDPNAHIEYREDGFLFDKVTTNLDLKVKKMTVKYDDDKHDVKLLLKKE